MQVTRQRRRERERETEKERKKRRERYKKKTSGKPWLVAKVTLRQRSWRSLSAIGWRSAGLSCDRLDGREGGGAGEEPVRVIRWQPDKVTERSTDQSHEGGRRDGKDHNRLKQRHEHGGIEIPQTSVVPPPTAQQTGCELWRALERISEHWAVNQVLWCSFKNSLILFYGPHYNWLCEMPAG